MSPLPRFGLQKTTAPLSRYLARQAAALADRWRGRNVYKTAVENMWQGIALYDRTGHLLLHNAQFCTMLGLSRREVTAARTHRDVVRLSVAAGNHGEVDADRVWRDDVAFIARSQPSLTYLDLPNLRIIAGVPPAAEGRRLGQDLCGRQRPPSVQIPHHPSRRLHDVLTNLPKSDVFPRASGTRVGACLRPHVVCAHVPRPRPVQGGQRHAWTCDRGHAAPAGRRSTEGNRTTRRHGRCVSAETNSRSSRSSLKARLNPTISLWP